MGRLAFFSIFEKLVARRTRGGLSKKEIHRCLKRYIVRELYPLILADLNESMRPS